MKLDAKMTFGQAQNKEKDPWTTNPLARTLKLNDIISAGNASFLGVLTSMRHWGLPFALYKFPKWPLVEPS